MPSAMVPVRANTKRKGQFFVSYWLTLILLGVGWNFMFIAGTTLLAETYRPEEKALVQGVN